MTVSNENTGKPMPIKKQYLERKPICKVTFEIPAEVGGAAKTAKIVGEYEPVSI
jgi:hypothetical protein